MTFSSLFDLFKRYAVLGIVVAAVLCLLWLFAYQVVYKKLCKGKKTVPLWKQAMWVVFICYLTVIAGAVFLDRGGHGYAQRQVLNAVPFTLFREAWHSFGAVVWRNFILNIAAFIPLGILLPLLSEKLRRLWKTVGIGCAFTLAIESLQYITGRGQASTDDVLTNTWGVLIGYGLFMAFMAVKSKTSRKPLKALGYISPVLSSFLAAAAVLMVYQAQALGNLSEGFYIKQNMRGVELTCEIELSEVTPTTHIYRIDSFDKARSREFAEAFFARIGTSFQSEREPVYYDESAFYYSDFGILHVEYQGKTYGYTDFSSEADADLSMNEAQVRLALSEWHGIEIPENAGFINQGDGSYTFEVSVENGQGQTGSFACTILSDGIISSIDCQLLELTDAAEYEAISPATAYKRIVEGKLNYRGYFGKLGSLEIMSMSMDYRIDSKGFFRPVYFFGTLINGQEYPIAVPA